MKDMALSERIMDQLKRDVSEVIVLESLNAQRIDKLNDHMGSMRDTLRDSVSQLAMGVATQAQTLSGFRELYAREISFIHRQLDDMRASLDVIEAGVLREKDKILAVEKDIAVARGSVKGMLMSWSGFAALIGFLTDKILVFMGKK